MQVLKRLIGVISVGTILLAASACGSTDPTATTVPPTPAAKATQMAPTTAPTTMTKMDPLALLKKAGDTMDALTGVHSETVAKGSITMDMTGSGTATPNDFSLNIISDSNPKDKTSDDVTTTKFGPVNNADEKIRIGDACYNRTSSTGDIKSATWTKGDAKACTQDKSKITDQVKNVTEVGEEDLNGTKVHHLQAEYDPTKVTPVAGSTSPPTSFSGKIDIFVGSSDSYIYEVKANVVLPMGNAGPPTTLPFDIKYSKFNTPVTITAPEIKATSDTATPAAPAMGDTPTPVAPAMGDTPTPAPAMGETPTPAP